MAKQQVEKQPISHLLPSQNLLRKHVPKVMQASMGAGRCIWDGFNALRAQLKKLIVPLLDLLLVAHTLK